MTDRGCRIDMKREDVVAAVERRDWPLLQAADQLIKARQLGHAFADYNEAPLDFPPTYRYHKGVAPRTHAAYNDEKQRIPAWCDRVLWRTWENVTLQPKFFNCVDTVTTSDHSPVHAAFDLTCVRVPPPVPQHLVTAHELYALTIEDLRVSDINVLDAPHLSSCIAQIVCQCALAQVYCSDIPMPNCTTANSFTLSLRSTTYLAACSSHQSNTWKEASSPGLTSSASCFHLTPCSKTPHRPKNLLFSCCF
jgi:hypothetical protein